MNSLNLLSRFGPIVQSKSTHLVKPFNKQQNILQTRKISYNLQNGRLQSAFPIFSNSSILSKNAKNTAILKNIPSIHSATRGIFGGGGPKNPTPGNGNSFY